MNFFRNFLKVFFLGILRSMSSSRWYKEFFRNTSPDCFRNAFKKFSKNLMGEFLQKFSPKFLNIFSRNSNIGFQRFSWSSKGISRILLEFPLNFFRYSSGLFNSTSCYFPGILLKIALQIYSGFLLGFLLRLL